MQLLCRECLKLGLHLFVLVTVAQQKLMENPTFKNIIIEGEGNLLMGTPALVTTVSEPTVTLRAELVRFQTGISVRHRAHLTDIYAGSCTDVYLNHPRSCQK